MTAYYNELDPYPAQWTRNLIEAGHVTPGYVDNRSIKEVKSDDLIGYDRCHFFSGIAVWDHALRLAGWPYDREVWTGSCPCQPFSAVGKRGGTDDPRHLWPEWFRLIRERRPGTIFGEQVASKDGLAWLDLVYDDLESAGYAVAAFDLCAAGAGAPHIRQRLYFVANACGRREQTFGPLQQEFHAKGSGEPSSLAHAQGRKQRGIRQSGAGKTGGELQNRGCGATGLLADASIRQREQPPDTIRSGRARSDGDCNLGDASQQGLAGWAIRRGDAEQEQPTAERTGSFWSDLEWLQCRDGKARPTKPGLFPLANGAAARVGRLRAYGNAIVAPLAAEFIRAYMDEMGMP